MLYGGSTKRDASNPNPQCLQRTSGSNKKSSLKTCRSPSSMSKYCITASTDKDEVVNEDENNGRTEMQSHDVLPPFWFSRCPKVKPSAAPVTLQVHLCLNWHPRYPIPQLLLSFLFSFSSRCSYCLVSDTTHPKAATQDEYELRVPITVFSALTASSLLLFFLLYFSGLALSNNTYRRQAATTRHRCVLSFTLFYPSFMRLYCIQSSSPATPEVASTIQIL
jgi:hypothetical protein